MVRIETVRKQRRNIMHPYIGITGFTKPEEVYAALHVFPHNHSRKLMVGVPVTWKSLRGIPMKPWWAKQSPDPASINRLFLNDERVVNLVHLSTEEGQESSLLADMFRAHELAGPNFHGFQLNVAWPQINQMDDYRAAMEWNYRIVLQLGQKAVETAGGTPRGVADMLYHYAGVIDDIVFDPSGGLGRRLDAKMAREFLSEIAGRGWDIGLGAAGGINAYTLHLIELLISDFPDLSIDTQSGVRNAENDLDISLMHAFLINALALFDGRSVA